MKRPGGALILVRSFAMGIVLLGLWTWWVPRALGFQVRSDFAAAQPRTIAGICILLAGFALWLTCLVQFAREGAGTLLPIDAPRHLVVHGVYRYVRNPMYLGVAILLFGEAVALANFDRYLLIYFGSLTIVTVAFVRFYEEPHLRKLFGTDYDNYRAHVRAWLPSLRPWPSER